MKIAVIAANGRTGRHFVEEALQHKHEVIACVHNSSTITPHNFLTVTACDATNQDDVIKATKKADAIVSFIGHVKKSPDNLQTEAIKNIIKAAEVNSISRVVSLTGTGVRFNGDKITVLDRLLNFSIKFIDPTRIADGIEHAQILKQSSLKWTIIRVLKLTNRKAASYTLTSHGPTKLFTSRKEVAKACLEVLENQTFINDAPIISKHIN